MISQNFCKTFSLVGNEISLEQLLTARENRVALQQKCLAQYGQTVLSLTLLAVGGVKKNELLDYIFARSLESLNALLARLNISPTAEFIRPLETGHEAIFVLPIKAETLKKACIALEDSSPLARLWDIDVIAPTGDPIGKLLSRTELGFSPRSCLCCEENAKLCARSRRHSLAEIVAEMQKRACEDFFVEQIAEKAYHALLQEVYLTPKAGGLVDQRNNGSHKDMDVQTFEQSALALRPFFADFVRKGIATQALPTSQILSEIRPLGIKAEQAMFAATNGVNTHKGAIFAFGLICTALGRLWALEAFQSASGVKVADICHLVQQFSQGLTAELQNYPENAPLTAGVRLFREHGLTGARGEAESGFALMQETLLFLAKYQGLSVEHRLQIALLHFIGRNDDTNVVHRAGLAGLKFVKTEANKRLENAKLLQNATALQVSLEEFDDECIKRNISCGGSADLLALTIFFLSLNYQH